MATKKENLRPEAATLSYSDACLGDEGTRELCSQLLDHRMLTSLDLRGCQIHAAGTAAITPPSALRAGRCGAALAAHV